jgi:hypothetical protein
MTDSAITSDAARWLQITHAGINKRPRSRSKSPSRPLPDPLNEFQAKVAMILGMVFNGIHNAPIDWHRGYWAHDAATLTLTSDGGRFSTYDFDKLTVLVLLCHAAAIRGGLQAGGFRSLALSFHERRRDGSMSERHPTIDQAIALLDRFLPIDSPLRFERQAESPAAPQHDEG